MQEAPTKELLGLLERLDLASAAAVMSLAPQVRRLAKGLPLFDSVWVDVLAQAKLLTPYQAQEITAGRGEGLGVDQYVLLRPHRSPVYMKTFTARVIGSSQMVRLAIADVQSGEPGAAKNQLQTLVDTSRPINDLHLLCVRAGGIESCAKGTTRLWAASDDVEGITAAEWMVPNGRFPPHLVVSIAQQMTAALARLEHFEIHHGDIAAVNTLLDQSGQVRLLMPGLRAILRPEEGYSHADLAPEAYENVAPERLVDGSPPTTASELYACGCLWWQLLAGRPPIRGGDSLTKLRNAQRGRVADIRQLAPDVPEPLATAISKCLSADPDSRGTSFAALAEHLGSPASNALQDISDCVARFRNPRVSFHAPAPNIARSGNMKSVAGVTTAIATAVVVAVLGYDHFRAADLPVASVPAPKVEDVVRKPAEAPAASATPAPTTTSDEAYRNSHIVRLDAADAAQGRLPKLRSGMTVQADPQGRATFEIPPQGLSVTEPHVRFENIDFVWKHSQRASPGGPAAMITLDSHWVEFYRCSFQAAESPLGAAQPVAIAFTAAEPASAHGDRAPNCHVILDECVLRRVSAAVELARPAALSCEAVGTLHLGAGPLVRLGFYPGRDQPVELSLRHCTLRGATSLLACRYDQVSEPPAKISIVSINSVFAPQVDGALLAFEGASSPAALIRLASWRGQGSLLSELVPIASWMSATDGRSSLPGAELPAEGISHCRFDFAGPQVEVPEASRVVRWSAALRSADPPGIRAARLTLPDVSAPLR